VGCFGQLLHDFALDLRGEVVHLRVVVTVPLEVGTGVVDQIRDASCEITDGLVVITSEV
jgi:hypothetical protein